LGVLEALSSVHFVMHTIACASHVRRILLDWGG